MLKIIKSPVLRQFAAVIIANLSIINLGMHIVWASPMLIKFRDPDQEIVSRPPTEDELAWMVSINQLFGVFALFFTGSLVSYFGRRTLLIYVYIPRLLTCLLMLFTTDMWMVLVAKSLGGIADMGTLSAVSTYAAEVAGKEIRGASGTLTQIMSATGMMIMFAVGPFVSYLAVNVMMTCIVVLTFIPLLFIPESPYFLYTKGRTQDALETLILLRGTEELANEEIKEFATDSNKGDAKVDKWAVFKDRIVLKTFGLAMFLSIGLTFTGYNAVNFYLQTVFESTGVSLSSEVSSLIIGVIQLLACCCTFFLTDRFGRKPIFCISLVGMLIGMIGLATFFVLYDTESEQEITGFLNFLPLISIMIVIYGYNAGLGSLFWIVLAELFEGQVRPYAVSSGILIAGITSFLMTFFFPELLSSIGAAGMYYIFAGGCMVECLVIYFFVPETKGRSFAEIQSALGKDLNEVKDNNEKS